MLKPLISIIVPVYNGIKFLDRCFRTLEKQSYPNLEIIFVDNNSIDGSKEKIIDYCSKNKNHFFINCSKQGPGIARNKGIENASGEYISFLDVDDEINSNKHDILLNSFYQYPTAVMAIGRTKKIYSSSDELLLPLGNLKIGLNSFPSSGILWLQSFHNNPHLSSSLIKKNVIIKSNIYFPDLKYGEDVAFNVQLGVNNDIIIIDELVSNYHRHNQSTISLSNKQISRIERYFHFYEKFALSYFSSKKNNKIFNECYKYSDRTAYRLLMQLIKVEKKVNYKNKLYILQSKSLISNSLFRGLLFNIFPYNIARLLNEKLNRIKDICF